MSSRASDDDAFEASTEHSSLLTPKKGPGVAVEDEQPSKRKGALRTITNTTVISALAIAFIVMAVLLNRSSYGDIDLSEGLTASNYYTERDGQFATMCVALLLEVPATVLVLVHVLPRLGFIGIPGQISTLWWSRTSIRRCQSAIKLSSPWVLM